SATESGWHRLATARWTHPQPLEGFELSSPWRSFVALVLGAPPGAVVGVMDVVPGPSPVRASPLDHDALRLSSLVPRCREGCPPGGSDRVGEDPEIAPGLGPPGIGGSQGTPLRLVTAPRPARTAPHSAGSRRPRSAPGGRTRGTAGPRTPPTRAATAWRDP